MAGSFISHAFQIHKILKIYIFLFNICVLFFKQGQRDSLDQSPFIFILLLSKNELSLGKLVFLFSSRILKLQTQLLIYLCFLNCFHSAFWTSNFNFAPTFWHSHNCFTTFALKISMSFSVSNLIYNKFNICFWFF